MSVTQAGMSEHLHAALAVLKRNGLLLEADPILPSLATIIAGEPVHGSWWGHRAGNDIYNTAGELADRPDVLLVKLISKKITYVHRDLFPALLAVVQSGEPWQMRKLSAGAAALFERVQAEGLVRMDRIPLPEGTPLKVAGSWARELEPGLLALGDSLHTEKGAHVKVVESWEHCIRRLGLELPEMGVEEGKVILEERVERMNRESGGAGRLPWMKR